MDRAVLQYVFTRTGLYSYESAKCINNTYYTILLHSIIAVFCTLPRTFSYLYTSHKPQVQRWRATPAGGGLEIGGVEGRLYLRCKVRLTSSILMK